MDDDATPETQQVQDASEAVTRRAMRSAHKDVPDALLPKVTDSASYEAVPHGQHYLTPEGKKQYKYYDVKGPDDYYGVPEGAQYLTPEGTPQTKQKSEPIDFTSQTLFNMGTNDKERRKALERSYPGKVRQEGKEWLVDDDGVLRKPKGFVEGGAAASLAGGALPTIGAGVGEAIGGLAGSIPGAVGGAFAGGATGQAFNDLAMAWAGTYDRSVGAEVGELAKSGAVAGAGSAVGRGISGIVASGKAAKSLSPSGVAAGFLGADPAKTAQARGIAEVGEHESSSRVLHTLGMSDPGTEVPAAAWAMEAPALHNVEAWEEAFHTQKPLLQSIAEHYERGSHDLLGAMGDDVPGSIAKPVTAPNEIPSGKALKDKVIADAMGADAKLADELIKRKAAAEAGFGEKAGAHNTIIQVAEESHAKARKVLDLALKDMQRSIDHAMTVAKANSNSGDLWWTVAEKFQALRAGAMARHQRYYQQVYDAAGKHIPDSAGLPDAAEQVLKQLPEGFESSYPKLVRTMRDWAGDTEPNGEVVREPVTPDIIQLHQLRSLLRHNVDWYKINTDFKDGPVKFFAKRVDEILHPKVVPLPSEPGAELTREQSLGLASKLLDITDASYGDAMKIFNSTEIRSTIKALEAGEAPDAKRLLSTLYREGKTDTTLKIKDMLGPVLTRALAATDKQEILNAAKTFDKKSFNMTKIASEILDRRQSGMLDVVHGENVGNELFKLGRAISMLEGKIEITVGNPRDTLLDIMRKARIAGEAAKAEGERDPLQMLGKEMSKIEAEHAQTMSRINSARQNEPLGFLYDETVGAAAAANKILSSPDLIVAASAKFGNDSPQFKLLQQLWVKRILFGTMNPAKELSGISEQVQRLLLPGATYAQMQVLAKNADFLLSAHGAKEGVSMGMAALSQVSHPWAHILGGSGGGISKALVAPMKIVPGANPLGRKLLGDTYGLIRKIASSPSFLRWVEKGLQGDAEARAMVKAEVRRWMKRGSTAGAAGAEAEYQRPERPK